MLRSVNLWPLPQELEKQSLRAEYDRCSERGRKPCQHIQSQRKSRPFHYRRTEGCEFAAVTVVIHTCFRVSASIYFPYFVRYVRDLEIMELWGREDFCNKKVAISARATALSGMYPGTN